MDCKLRKLFKSAKLLHGSMYNEMRTIMQEAVEESSIEKLAEIAFIFRKTSALIDDLRKQINKAEAILEIAVCKKWVTQTEPSEIKTDYISVTPKLKIQTTLPSAKTNPEDHEKLLRALNIPEHCWPLIRLHWPAMCEYLTELAEQGKPFPDGLDPRKTTPQYSLKFHQRKEIVAIDDTLYEDIPF